MKSDSGKRVRGGWLRAVAGFTLVTMLTGLAVAPASAAKSSTGDKVKPPKATKQLPPPAETAALRRQVRAAIKFVERARVACPTRNSALSWLRAIDDNLRAGRRSAAAGLLDALITYVGSMNAAGLLTTAQRDMLHTRLSAVSERVGTGWSTKPPKPRAWPALEDCTDGGHQGPDRAGVVGGPSMLAVHVILSIVVKGAFAAAKNIASLYGVEWPGTSAGIKGLIDDAMTDDFKALVGDTLDGLDETLNNFVGWESCCAKDNPAAVLSAWFTAQGIFVLSQSIFQDERYQVELLPLYAQYENLYITLLREAVLFGSDWGMAQTTVDQAAALLTASVAEARSYVDAVYHAGQDELPNPDDPQKNFADRNPYERNMALQVLDYAAAWPYQDPTVHGFATPDFRLERMIYSDAIGHAIQKEAPFSAPPNVYYPLSNVSAWTETQYNPEDRTEEIWLSAMQADNSPLAGPITGDSDLTPVPPDGTPPTKSSWAVAPGSTLGPIVQVDAKTWREGLFYKFIIQSVRFHFANGGSGAPGPFYDRQIGPEEVHIAYADEVVATAKIMGPFTWSHDNDTGDSLVLGFRYADSYYPAGEVRNVGAGKCIDLPHWGEGAHAVIHTCYWALSQDWTYNSATQELTSTGGDANGGVRCLEAYHGGTVPGTPVDIYHCMGNAAQKWTISSDGSIVNQLSRLCLAVSGDGTADNTALELATCNGSAAQQWVSPWTIRQASTVQAGPGATGACIDVQSNLREDGTPVQMSGCNPNVWHQQWNYDDESREFQVYGATKCLSPSGSGPAVPDTPVVIADCSGDAAQQWTLGATTIVNDQSGLCLDRPSISAGALLRVSSCNGGESQQWNWRLR